MRLTVGLRGKIERWFRTLRAQFLRHLGAEELASLEALNAALRTYVERECHESPHPA